MSVSRSTTGTASASGRGRSGTPSAAHARYQAPAAGTGPDASSPPATSGSTPRPSRPHSPAGGTSPAPRPRVLRGHRAPPGTPARLGPAAGRRRCLAASRGLSVLVFTPLPNRPSPPREAPRPFELPLEQRPVEPAVEVLPTSVERRRAR